MLLVSDDSLPLVHAELRYRCVDPFAVQLRLSLDRFQAVSWTFGRDLLIAGISRPRGIGDVRIYPGGRWCAHRTPISHRPARPCSERNELQCRLDGARANITHLNAQRVTDLFPDSQKDTRRNSAPPAPPPERSL